MISHHVPSGQELSSTGNRFETRRPPTRYANKLFENADFACALMHASWTHSSLRASSSLVGASSLDAKTFRYPKNNQFRSQPFARCREPPLPLLAAALPAARTYRHVATTPLPHSQCMSLLCLGDGGTKIDTTLDQSEGREDARQVRKQNISKHRAPLLPFLSRRIPCFRGVA